MRAALYCSYNTVARSSFVRLIGKNDLIILNGLYPLGPKCRPVSRSFQPWKHTTDALVGPLPRLVLYANRYADQIAPLPDHQYSPCSSVKFSAEGPPFYLYGTYCTRTRTCPNSSCGSVLWYWPANKGTFSSSPLVMWHVGPTANSLLARAMRLSRVIVARSTGWRRGDDLTKQHRHRKSSAQGIIRKWNELSFSLVGGPLF